MQSATPHAKWGLGFAAHPDALREEVRQQLELQSMSSQITNLNPQVHTLAQQ